MRLSLGVHVIKEEVAECSKCKRPTNPLLYFGLTMPDHAGTIEPICLPCLMKGDLVCEVPMESFKQGPTPRRKALRKGQRSSQKQELELAEELGGRRQPGSGNQNTAKGDVRTKGVVRVEAKLTTNDTYRLHLDDFWKIDSEKGSGEVPSIVIDFLERGTRKLRDRLAVIHFDDLKKLLGRPT